MARKIDKAVFDTGPFIHLNEIDLLRILKLFKSIMVVDEVFNELNKNADLHTKIKNARNIKLLQLKPQSKDMSKLLVEKYNIGLAESSSISLSMQEKADVFITDDLEARTTAKNFGLEVHGTVGVIVRAFREGIIPKDMAISKIRELYEKSSLFITKDLADFAVKEIRGYRMG